jgi:hypothetical protein
VFQAPSVCYSHLVSISLLIRSNAPRDAMELAEPRPVSRRSSGRRRRARVEDKNRAMRGPSRRELAATATECWSKPSNCFIPVRGRNRQGEVQSTISRNAQRLSAGFASLDSARYRRGHGADFHRQLVRPFPASKAAAQGCQQVKGSRRMRVIPTKTIYISKLVTPGLTPRRLSLDQSCLPHGLVLL